MCEPNLDPQREVIYSDTTEINPSNEFRLCARCAALDFYALFTQPYGTFAFEEFKSPTDWANLECDFCNFIILPPPSRILGHGIRSQTPYTLLYCPIQDLRDGGLIPRVVHSKSTARRQFYSRLYLENDEHVLAIDFVRTPSGPAPSIRFITSMVDYDMIKSWLRANATSEICGTNLDVTEDISSSFATARSGFDITLCVIDCANRSLVQLPSQCQYVTLSYVWGEQPEDHGPLRATLTSERHRLDLLPPDVPATIEDSITRVSQENDIKTSVWAQRGWTYQETLLSRARLYFTNQQLYFENESSVVCEFITLNGVDKSTSGNWIFSRQTWLTEHADIHRCLGEFSARTLSFPRDTLDVVRGILAAFDRKFQVRHLSGIPFIKIPLPTAADSLVFSKFHLLSGLLFWTREDSVRRKEFPSWSWAGWTGSLCWFGWLNGYTYKNSDTCIAVEHVVDQAINWEEYQTIYDDLPPHVVRYIHVQGCVSPFLLSQFQHKGDRNQNVIVFSHNVHLKWCGKANSAFAADSLARTDMKAFAVLRFLSKVDGAPDSYVPHLMIADMGTHWERVEMVEAKYIDHNGFPLDLDASPSTHQTIRLG
ncbi:hypothetical protein OPT61_g4063 [Boeremia exigua]|uniref:Uncharacterized protein n=1 Tax=Boeremia exigua TaxID=749465 RepID=A0ACC2IFL8_9PLEO|nr:hypothetical protein OPT61_g4063 [Boeremia exigua]